MKHSRCNLFLMTNLNSTFGTYRKHTVLILLLSVKLQEFYAELVYKKAKIEEQLKEISLALGGMEVTKTI